MFIQFIHELCFLGGGGGGGGSGGGGHMSKMKN
jgi:hypothetical protein